MGKERRDTYPTEAKHSEYVQAIEKAGGVRRQLRESDIFVKIDVSNSDIVKTIESLGQQEGLSRSD